MDVVSGLNHSVAQVRLILLDCISTEIHATPKYIYAFAKMGRECVQQQQQQQIVAEFRFEV